MKGISEETLKTLLWQEYRLDIKLALNYLIKQCQELNIMKPIDDNTPKNHPILLLTEYDVMVEGYFVDFDGGYWVEGVTHDEIKPKAWQYLPTLPKGEP